MRVDCSLSDANGVSQWWTGDWSQVLIRLETEDTKHKAWDVATRKEKKCFLILLA